MLGFGKTKLKAGVVEANLLEAGKSLRWQATVKRFRNSETFAQSSR